MNVFEVAKTVTARQAAEHYGLKISRNGMACCPFHSDKSPSMKVDARYYCFGCGATGDAVDLTVQLLGLAPRDAALRLAEDFGLAVNDRAVRGKSRPKKTAKPRADPEKEAAEWITKAVRMLLDYHWKLIDWKERFAPRSMEEEWHPLFCEALDKKEWIEYLLDELLFCGKDQYAEMKIRHGKEVMSLECQLEKSLERERGCDQGYPVTDVDHGEMPDQTDHQQLSAGVIEGSSAEGSIPAQQADGENRCGKRSRMAER